MFKLLGDHMEVLNASKGVHQGLELAKANIQWIKDFQAPISQWIQTRKSAPAFPNVPTGWFELTDNSSSVN